MSDTPSCHVYKSLKMQDYYLFIPHKDVFDELPEVLGKQLGPLEYVMEVELTPGRRLARISVEELQARLEAQGFHLQMPPRDEERV